MRFAIVIEKAERNYSAYVPDLPGCVTTGQTIEEVKRLMAEAIAFHIDGMLADGDQIPDPTTVVTNIEVEIPTSRPAGKSRARAANPK